MENDLIGLIAQDRVEMPLCSMRNKLQKRKFVIAKSIAEALGGAGGSYESRRVSARVEAKDRSLARGMKEAVAEFVKEYPLEGAVLKKKIAGKRQLREEHLYFETSVDTHLTGEDYMKVMRDLGMSEHQAHLMYPSLMGISRSLDARRGRVERSIIVGKYEA